MKKIRPLANIRLTSASKQAMKLVGVIHIFIQFGYIKFFALFGVIESIDVSEILSTSLIDRFIKEIFPAERKIIPRHSGEVLILAKSTYDSALSTILDEESAFTVKEKTGRSK